MPIFNPILVGGGGGGDAVPFSDNILGFFSSKPGNVLSIVQVLDVNGEQCFRTPSLSLPCAYWADRAALPSKLKEVLGPNYSSDAMVIDGTLSRASFDAQSRPPYTVCLGCPGSGIVPVFVVTWSRYGWEVMEIRAQPGTVEYTYIPDLR